MKTLLVKEATAFDHAVSLWLHHLDSPSADIVMRVFTFLGSPWAIAAVVALVAAWAIRSRARPLAGVLIAVALVAEGLTFLLKMAFQRTRPDLFAAIAVPRSYSFPSGHAMLATAVYGMAAVVATRLRPSLRLPLAIITPLFVVLVGLSRVFLGVHWPTDVLAGFAAGGTVVVAGVLALRCSKGGALSSR
jgi:membrane-associated phospholipid phosphatase